MRVPLKVLPEILVSTDEVRDLTSGEVTACLTREMLKADGDRNGLITREELDQWVRRGDR